MPALEKRKWTIAEVERLIDERIGYAPRYELVDGELLVTPSPNGRHQRILARLFLLFHPYVSHHRLGELRFSPADVRLTSATRFEPDLFVIPAVEGRMPRAMAPVTDLLFAAEVLSPSSARHDRITKRRFFQEHGIVDYWVIDGEAETFEIWHPTDERAELADSRATWHPVAAAEPMLIDVRRFFADVADED